MSYAPKSNKSNIVTYIPLINEARRFIDNER